MDGQGLLVRLAWTASMSFVLLSMAAREVAAAEVDVAVPAVLVGRAAPGAMALLARIFGLVKRAGVRSVGPEPRGMAVAVRAAVRGGTAALEAVVAMAVLEAGVVPAVRFYSCLMPL